MKLRYILSMMSLSLAHLLVASTLTLIMGKFENFYIIIPVNIGWLIGVNALGAHFIFAPIDRFLKSGGDAAAAIARVKALAAMSVTWGVFLVSCLAVFALFVLQRLCPGCDQWTMLPYRVATIALFAIFCGTFLYFLIGDFSARLRAELFERHGVLVGPGGGKLVHKFLLAFVAVGVLPASLAFLEAFLFSEARALQGLEPEQGFLFALVISLFMAATAFYFIPRNLSRPVDTLLASVRRVGEGDLETRTPVITDDEIGVLAAGFNSMVEGLRERQVMRETFGKYVPESVARALLANKGEFRPQHRLATILYTDIQGFTTICEAMSPDDVVAPCSTSTSRCWWRSSTATAASSTNSKGTPSWSLTTCRSRTPTMPATP